MNAADICLCNLDIGFSGRRKGLFCVAKGLVSQAERSRLTCLIGRNGVGKSTLLRTIAGFQPPLAGKIMVAGDDIATMSRAERARRVAVVLTSPIDTLNMTVADIVGLGRTPYTRFWGRLSGDDHRVVDRVMSLTGIDHLANRPIGQLSDGERQKVMVAKALAQETPVIILDEPTAFLDYPSRLSLMRLLSLLARDEHRTILLSTHDIDMVRAYADSVWLLAEGKIQSGDADAMVRLMLADSHS